MKGFVRRLIDCKDYYCNIISEAKWLNSKKWAVGDLFFDYKRQVTVTEQSGNDLTDYQVLIELDSTNFDFSHANEDGSDIRFYDGSNLYPYWIEKWDSVNQEARVWVKVPSIPASSSTSFYMYYGNPNVVSASSPELTFVRVIDGCILALPMDEGSGDTVYDKSGNNNDGTIYGGTTWTDGKFGKALSFDGVDDYVEVSDSESLRPNYITILCWFRLDGMQGEIAKELVNKVGPSGNFGYGIELKPQIRYRISTDGSTLTGAEGSTPEYGKWYFIAMTFDGSYIRGYLNGELDAKEALSGTIYPSTANLRIGSYEYDTTCYYFYGIIDEVCIYNRALSEEEIQDLYNYYGYNTENYPGKTLVRKRVEPEPTATIGTEETP